MLKKFSLQHILNFLKPTITHHERKTEEERKKKLIYCRDITASSFMQIAWKLCEFEKKILLDDDNSNDDDADDTLLLLLLFFYVTESKPREELRITERIFIFSFLLAQIFVAN